MTLAFIFKNNCRCNIAGDYDIWTKSRASIQRWKSITGCNYWLIASMRKTLQSVFDFILFSNIFMALCAVAQGLVTFYLIGAKPVVAVLWLLFTSTIGVYNFSILISKPDRPKNSPYARERWFFAHYRLMINITIVCLWSLIPFVINIIVRLQVEQAAKHIRKGKTVIQKPFA